MSDPQTLDDVLYALDAVLIESREERSRAGYFAAIYRKVTAKVKEGIANGFFDDGPRMERLDVVFARRYLDALRDFQHHRPPTRSWARAFDALADPRPIIVQHLLLGINAHINLDLGIAAAQVAPGAQLPGLRRDFDRINEILGLLVARVMSDVGEVSPLIGLLDWAGGRDDEVLVNFSLDIARTEAWRFATELAPIPRPDWGGAIGARDTRVVRLARAILNPGLVLGAALLTIRSVESNDVRRVIDVLCDVEEPTLAAVEARLQE